MSGGIDVAKGVAGGVQVGLQSDRQRGDAGERVAGGEDARLGQVLARPQVEQSAGVAPFTCIAIRRDGSSLAGEQTAIGVEGLRQGQRPGGAGQLARRAEGIRQEILPSVGRLLGDAPHGVQVAVRAIGEHLGQ
jgi:hypothetical protein